MLTDTLVLSIKHFRSSIPINKFKYFLFSFVSIDIDSTTILEVNAISFQQISVALQHPYEESMATVEFDLRTGVPQCSIYSISNNYDLLSLKLSNIVQKCLSIPVTIRALLRFWEQECRKMFQRSIGGVSTNAGSMGGGANTGGGGNMSANMPSTSHAAYGGNFNISGGSNDPGGGGMGGNMKMCGNIKMETAGGQQRSQLQLPSAGFLKFKGGDLKQEDFHESPKSQTLAVSATENVAVSLMQSNLEVNSLGLTLSQQQQQQQQKQILHTQQQQLQQSQQTYEQKIAADNEIADKYKNIWKDKTPTLKNTVSITPINDVGSSGNILSGNPTTSSSTLDVKRTGGIEIIPLTGQNNSTSGVNNAAANSIATPTTITITPINAGVSSTPMGNKEKKSSTSLGSSSSSVLSSSSSSSKRSLDTSDGQKDKKRKKRRDDSPMGPPEKVFSRQNSPAGSGEVAATAVVRKFSSPSSSPKGSSGGMLASSVAGSSLSARPSPKHSPVYSSPKHNTASNSPKSPFGTHSPKHGSSGKPSMSTLKSATAASPKGDKTNSSSNSSSSSVLNTAALVRSLASGSSSSSTANTVAAAAAAAAAAAMANLKNKDKIATLNPAAINTAAVAAAAAAAVKSSMGVSSMQQLKSSIGGSLNHMSAAAAAGFGSANNPNSSLELNTAMRKGVAAAVSHVTV